MGGTTIGRTARFMNSWVRLDHASIERPWQDIFGQVPGKTHDPVQEASDPGQHQKRTSDPSLRKAKET